MSSTSLYAPEEHPFFRPMFSPLEAIATDAVSHVIDLALAPSTHVDMRDDFSVAGSVEFRP